MNNNKVAQLDKFGYQQNSPITQGTPQPAIVPWQFGMKQKIQTKVMKASQANIRSFVKFSNTNLALGTIPNGGSAFLETTLTPQPPHAAEPSFAIANVGVFIGTSPTVGLTVNQIYPTVGGSQLGQVGKWDIRGDYDVNGAGGTNSGTIAVWHGIIINNSGANGTIQFATRWSYIQFNSGTIL